MKKLRAAIIGLAHIHVINMTNDFSRHPDMYEIVGMADVPPYTEEERKERIRKNVPADSKVTLFEDYMELLSKDIDLAIICTDIKDHADITVKILAMGINVVIEKPMCIDSEDAERIYKAYKESKAQLYVNWPIAWFPAFRLAYDLARSGEVGDILRVQYRSPATTGPYKPGELPEEELLKSCGITVTGAVAPSAIMQDTVVFLLHGSQESGRKAFMASAKISYQSFRILRIIPHSYLTSVNVLVTSRVPGRLSTAVKSPQAPLFTAQRA